MAEIRFEHVWKRYGNVEAVKDLNLKCENGEFLALLGPSGCGKTSSLRMLAGLEVISEGDLYIGDNRVNDIPPKDPGYLDGLRRITPFIPTCPFIIILRFPSRSGALNDPRSISASSAP